MKARASAGDADVPLRVPRAIRGSGGACRGPNADRLAAEQLSIVVRGRLLERAACSSGGSLEASFLFSGVIVAE